MMSDPDSDALVRLLFDQEDIKFAVNDGDFDKYLSKIGGLDIDELLKEPYRLKDEKNAVLEQTQELAYKNYKTFILTAECSRDIFKQFTGTENSVDSLIEKTSNLEKECEKFSNTTKDINVHRRLNSLMLTRNAQLLEILELPQLMESFIQDEQYENALELANYVRRLVAKHSEVSVFKNIQVDVERSWRAMLHQLIAQLRTDLQLPRCLQVVGYLRRMELFSEAELRLKFLQARNSWLESSLANVPKTDVSHHLNKTIELTRIGLFGIITQYRAIFNDDEHSPSNSARNQYINENLIFHSWLWEKISSFLDTLQSDLECGVPSIESILNQCMYFGLSFSRVGCDFRGLMVPIFTKSIKNTFIKAVDKATAEFEKNMERFTLINKNPPCTLWKSNSESLHPPENLLEFYPLAEYCNQILTALNELRLCAPCAIIDDVTLSLTDSLINVTKVILNFYGQEQQAFNQTSRDAFTRLCTCLSNDLIPYFQLCLHTLYPLAETALQLGVSVNEVQTMGISVIDRTSIMNPIAHLMPAKFEIVDIIEKDQIGN